MNSDNMKELLFHRKAMKILKESDEKRDVYFYSPEDNQVYMVHGNTVILAMERGIYKFYDSREEAEKAEIG